MTARRENGSPAGGARQSTSRVSSRAPADLSGSRHATGQSGLPQGGGGELDRVDLRHDQRAVPGGCPILDGADDRADRLAQLGALVRDRDHGERAVAVRARGARRRRRSRHTARRRSPVAGRRGGRRADAPRRPSAHRHVERRETVARAARRARARTRRPR